MKRIIRLLVVMLTIVSLEEKEWNACAQGDRRDRSGNEQVSKDYYFQRAMEVMKESGDYKKALEFINKQLQSAPGDVKTLMFRCQINDNLGKYGEALADINAAIKGNDRKSGYTDATLLWWKAWVYGNMGDRESNMEYLEKAYSLARKNRRKEGKNYVELCHNYCDKLTRSGQNQKSLAICRELMKEDESDIVAASLAARNMLADGNLEEAKEIIRKYSRFGINDTEFDYASMKVWSAAGDDRKAMDAALDYIGHRGEEPEKAMLLLLMKNKSYAEAALRKRIAENTGDVVTWRATLAGLYTSTHNYEAAVKEYLRLGETDAPKEYFANNLAFCFSELGMPEEAITTLEENGKDLIENSPRYYYCLLGIYHQEKGDYKKAIEMFDKASEADPTDVFPYYRRGWCFEFLKDTTKAMEQYTKGIELRDDYPYIFLMRGELYMTQGKKEQADIDFNAVIQKDTVLNDDSCRQYALHFLGKDKEALEWQDSLLRMYPDEPGIYYDQACLYARTGRSDDAVKALRNALEHGYRNLRHIEDDEDLDPVRNIPEYQLLMEKYSKEHGEFVERLRSEISKEFGAKEGSGTVTEVAFKRHQGGTFEIPCEINGLPLKMLFDTGASSVSVSSVEANFMLKNGYLSNSDFGGKEYYLTADGNISEGTKITLREVKIGDFILKNVKASVTYNQKAPILLGQSVMERFGTITIDNIGGKLLIKH